MPEALSAPSLAPSAASKAAAIRQQRLVWAASLNWRIQLQAALTASNRLPPHPHSAHDAEQRRTAEAAGTERQSALSSLDALQAGLLQLQYETRLSRRLAKRSGQWDNSETAQSEDQQPAVDEEVEFDEGSGEAEWGAEEGRWERLVHSARRLSAALRSSFALESEERCAVLDKWLRRTTAAAGSVDGGSASLLHRSAAEQLSDAVADRAALRRRTQLKRGQYDVVGQLSHDSRQQGKKRRAAPDGSSRLAMGGAQQSEHDENGAADENEEGGGPIAPPSASVRGHADLFDDLDFYQRLLHDAISGQQQQQQQHSPSLHTASLQSADEARRSLKAAVDRRASKGRKLQYTPIAKLSNFMAPVSAAHQQHSRDEALDQIVANLFGSAGS